ncbi:MAG TPA: ISKra4 family transposase [Thermomicrobiaceae bacterium]|nr:ISKra4 family transposase [Thermomicrobiaceae bacterium]
MEDSTAQRLIERTLAGMQEELRAVVCWLVEQREADLRTLEGGMLERGQRLVTRTLEAVLATSPTAVSRETLPCPTCQQPLVDLGPRPKTVHLTCGDLVLRRACRYCPHCQQVQAALDAQLGIDQSGRSPRLVEVLALLGTELPFAPAATRLARLCGLLVSPSQVQHVTEGVGRTWDAEEAARVARAWQTGDLPAVEQQAPWLLVTLDGVMVAEQDGYHEVRCGALAGAEPPAVDRSEPAVTPWRYVVTPADVTTFGQRVALEAGRQGLATATQVLVLGDGAHWIWNLAEEHFPQAVQILDLWHATEHLWAAGRARFGEGDPRVADWVAGTKDRLLAGEVPALLGEWAAVTPRDPTAWATELTYFTNQAQRMAYDQYHAAGYPLGSGAVESANRHVVGVRVKQAGMRWSEAGITGVLALRAMLRSDRWDAWWDTHSLPVPLAA